MLATRRSHVIRLVMTLVATAALTLVPVAATHAGAQEAVCVERNGEVIACVHY